MVWPFKSRSAAEPSFPIGQYRIDMPINGLEGLTPLSPEELVALNAAVQFKEEQIWHAPEAHFMGLKWDTILGTVRGSIYKIATSGRGRDTRWEKPTATSSFFVQSITEKERTGCYGMHLMAMLLWTTGTLVPKVS